MILDADRADWALRMDPTRLAAGGTITGPRLRRHDWRGVWSLWGPLLPLALAAGLYAGCVLARGWP